MSRWRSGLCLLPLAALSAAALAGARDGAVSVPASALASCASIAAPTERLACYDRLTGRAARSAPAPAAPAAAAPAVPPAPAQSNSFGLYAAEHPAPPKPAAALKIKVVALGVSTRGNPTVTLEGGQLWEIDRPDPLLAIGDSVTIHRAAFGSFLMLTPSGRRHRVERLR